MAAYRIVMRGASVHGGVASVLAFAAVLAVLILYIEQKTKRVPGPIAGLAIAVAILALGLWLAHDLTEASKMQDCLMSGRTNCNVIPAP